MASFIISSVPFLYMTFAKSHSVVAESVKHKAGHSLRMESPNARYSLYFVKLLTLLKCRWAVVEGLRNDPPQLVG